MKHIFETKVYYADTDAYGVVWHGTYLRWMEKGRVDLCDMLGLDLVAMKNNDVLLPVANMNVRYKASARLNDVVVVETSVKEMSPIRVTFEQTIRNKADNKLFIKAEFDVVAINEAGKLYRRMPEVVTSALQKAMEQ